MKTDWSSLPEDILDLVFKRFDSPSDYLRSSVACKSWHRVSINNRIEQAKLMSNSHHPPMLLFPGKEEGTWNLYNVIKDKVVTMQVSVPPNYRWFCGSSKGWLIATDENFVVTLINPLARVKGRKAKENSIIKLPPLTHQPSVMQEWRRVYHKYVIYSTISADPILYPNDCIVVIIYEYDREMAFLRLNKDTIWTHITGEASPGQTLHQKIYDVVNVQNKFFVLNRWDKLLSFDVEDEFYTDLEVVTCGCIEERTHTMFLVYLEDKRELMIIHRDIRYEGESSDVRETKDIRVYGLDMERFEWSNTKKNCLGGLSLFLGDNSTIVVEASKFPGCKSNCIYFNHDYDNYGHDYPPYDYGVFDYKTHAFTNPYNEEVKTQLKNTIREPIWILPTFHL